MKYAVHAAIQFILLFYITITPGIGQDAVRSRPPRSSPEETTTRDTVSGRFPGQPGISGYSKTMDGASLTIHYQGLLEENGEPATGIKNMTFSLYTTLTGGTPDWSENINVAMGDAGLFNVTLGEQNGFGGLDFSREYYLEVRVESVTPFVRQPLSGLFYSMRAAVADSAVNAGALGGYQQDDFAREDHDHNDDYYTKVELNTSDSTPPNQGENRVSWYNLTDVPDDFADGEDNLGEIGQGITRVDADSGLGGGGSTDIVHLWVQAGEGIVVLDDSVSLADDGVTTEKIADGTITSADIQNNTIQEEDMAFDTGGGWVDSASVVRLSTVTGRVYIGDPGSTPTSALNVTDQDADTERFNVVEFVNYYKGAALRVQSQHHVTSPDYLSIGIDATARNESDSAAFGGRFRAFGDGSGEHYGVYSTEAAGGSGAAIYAAGDLGYSGELFNTVATSRGHRKLYAVESSEVWIETVGQGRLDRGRTTITLDPLFLETVLIDAEHPLKVFVQLTSGEPVPVVVEKGTGGFSVIVADKESRATFDYRVMAKRKGYEAAYIQETTTGYNDPNLVPELREKTGADRE